jgi:bacterioferritin-associated ferredoxin
MYVCLCTGVTDAEIRAAYEAGASTPEAVSLATRAGSRCGSCRAEIAQIVGALANGEAPAVHARVCCRDDGKRHLDVHRERAGEAAPRTAA